MGVGNLYYGPDVDALFQTAVEEISLSDPVAPEQALIVEQNQHRHSTLAARWDGSQPAIAGSVIDATDLLTQWVEALEGPTSEIGTAPRRRLMEDVLASAPSAVSTEVPEPETLVSPMLQLITAMEESAIMSVAELNTALANANVSEGTRSVLESVFTAFRSRQSEYSRPGVKSRSGLFNTAITEPAGFTAAFPDAEHVIISGFYDPAPRLLDLLAAIPESVTIEILLPTPDTAATSSTDAAVAGSAIAAYQEVGATPEPVSAASTPTRDASAAMYRLASNHVDPADRLTWRELPSPRAEVRTVARELRAAVESGTPPDDIAVIVPGMLSYREHITDLFEAYGLPYTIQANKLLDQTFPGSALDSILQLAGEYPPAHPLIDLLENPLVTLPTTGTSPRALQTVLKETLEATHDRSLSTLLAALPDAERAVATGIYEDCQQLHSQSPADAVETVRNLFETLGVTAAVEDGGADPELGYDSAMERQGYQAIQRLIESVDTTSRVCQTDRSGVEAIEAALSEQMIPSPTQLSDGAISVIGLRDAYGKRFEYSTVLGATDEHLPARRETPAFFERIYDGIEELHRIEPSRRDRYLFRTLLANSQEVMVTTPAASIDGEPLIPSSIIAELARVTDIEVDDTRDSRHTIPEELHVELGRQHDPSQAVDSAATARSISASVATHINRGITLGRARAGVEPTRFDAQLPADVIDELPGIADPEPFSASSLSTYAVCGFRYYASKGLNLDSPEDISPVPNPATIGTLIHEILRETVETLQTAPGDPVQFRAMDPDTIADTILDATQTVLAESSHPGVAEMSWGTNRPFVRHIFEELFAGLGTAEANPYFDQGYPHVGQDIGLFARFIELEQDGDGPAYAEYPFGGLGDDAGEFTLETPLDGIRLRGQIDRIDIDSEGPPTVTVWDYKTGSTPSRQDTLDGVEFQLPTYLRAAVESLTESVEAEDAGYYAMSPPTDVKQKRGLRGAFDSDEEFEAFLNAEYPARVEQINDGVTSGAFQPTYLEAEAAGCEYCAFRDACDVRHHRRHERVKGLPDDHTQYVPAGLTGDEPFRYAPSDSVPADDSEDEKGDSA